MSPSSAQVARIAVRERFRSRVRDALAANDMFAFVDAVADYLAGIEGAQVLDNDELRDEIQAVRAELATLKQHISHEASGDAN